MMNHSHAKRSVTAPTVTEHHESGIRPAPSRTALVIEDDVPSARLVRLLLEAVGFTVVVAFSGEEAILLAPRHRLSLITLDIGLPGIDGWTCLKRLRDDPAVIGVPAVVIAALAYSHMGVTRGVDAMLQKPITRAELTSTLETLGLHPEKRRQATILIVDDPIAANLLAAHLPASDFSVVQAFEVDEALALARRLQPKLILLDLMTPDLSGLALIRALRHDPATAGIPVLVITARTLSEYEKSSFTGEGMRTIRVVDKAGLTPAAFITEVRNALV